MDVREQQTNAAVACHLQQRLFHRLKQAQPIFLGRASRRLEGDEWVVVWAGAGATPKVAPRVDEGCERRRALEVVAHTSHHASSSCVGARGAIECDTCFAHARLTDHQQRAAALRDEGVELWGESGSAA